MQIFYDIKASIWTQSNRIFSEATTWIGKIGFEK